MRQREFTSGKLEIKFGLCGTVGCSFIGRWRKLSTLRVTQTFLSIKGSKGRVGEANHPFDWCWLKISPFTSHEKKKEEKREREKKTIDFWLISVKSLGIPMASGNLPRRIVKVTSSIFSFFFLISLLLCTTHVYWGFIAFMVLILAVFMIH